MVGFDCVKTRTLAYVQSFRLITYHCSVFKDLLSICTTSLLSSVVIDDLIIITL